MFNIPFEFIFSDEALAQIKKLDNKTAKRMLDKLESTSSNPLHFFERLTGREESKLRIGDYRLIAKIMVNEQKVFILSLGHRKNIYKR